MTYTYLIKEKRDSVATIRFNNTKMRNALVMDLRLELINALEKADQDKEVRAIILTGEGKAFSAGGDLSALENIKPLEGRKRLQKSHQLVTKMLEIEKPIIAAVNGAAAGAGFSLALLCDLVIASERAFFVQSFVNVGLIPDLAAIHFLPLVLGPQKAKELMLLGERISAEEAWSIGIVNRVVKEDELLNQAFEIGEKLASKAPISIGMTKKVLNHHINRDLNVLLEMEAQSQEICFQTEDFSEGVNAFFEKREPRFIGK